MPKALNSPLLYHLAAQLKMGGIFSFSRPATRTTVTSDAINLKIIPSSPLIMLVFIWVIGVNYSLQSRSLCLICQVSAGWSGQCYILSTVRERTSPGFRQL